MKPKTKYYLVGNAHLDPVWQWRWQEGSMEAKSTIRSALDRMKEFPEFRFVCSSSSVYQWVEEFDPDMFEEVKQRVAEGRFVIIGGWHVQPDCNLPSGEAFARQSLYSQRYFMENLGTTAKVGYNVDSFGHNYMLPQILKKSGMDAYIMMRPDRNEKNLDSDLFEWISPDGSSVTTYRIANYAGNSADMAELERRLAHVDNATCTDIDTAPFFYGVGNHGGGPTIRNLELLREYRAAHPEKEFVYSDVHDFFEYVRASYPIPEFRDDLQHHAAGCYSTVHRIKNGIRRAETELSAAENFNMISMLLCGKKAKTSVFAEAWKNVCFCHFHDSMDGCSIKEVYDDADNMLGYSRHTAAVEENNAIQTISWNIDTSEHFGTPHTRQEPIVIFNPNSFDVEEVIHPNKRLFTIKDAFGNPVPSQLVHSTTNECYRRKDVIFKAKVPAMGYAVYYGKFDEPEEPEVFDTGVSAAPWTGHYTANEHGGTILENEFWRIRFEDYSGYITSFVNKATGEEIITGRSAVPTVIDEYYHDTWSHAKNFFTDEMARFSDAKVTVVENGPVRATVKVVSRYNDSTLTQYFSLTYGSDKLTVRAWVDWHEKYKMLKIKWAMKVDDPKAYYEIPYGVIERPADGEEEPGLMWTAVKGTNAGYALLNDCTYSSSVNGGTIYQTILRGCVYGDHGGPRTEESEFADQGRIDFNYTLMPVGESWAKVTKAARVLNKTLPNIIESWHGGKLSDKPYSALKIDSDHVIMSAIKRSEDGRGLVVRLSECDGRDTDICVTGDILPVPIKDTLTAWSTDTYYLEDGAAEWKKVLLTEYEL